MLALLVLVVVVVCVLLVGLLAVPVVVAVDARFENAAVQEARWRVRWIVGLVDVEWPRPRSERTSNPTPAATRPVKGDRPKWGGRAAVAALRTGGLLQRARRLVVTLTRQVRVDRWHAELTYGFEDPSDTGVVCGLVSPLLLLCERRGLPVDCRPFFLDSALNGSLGAVIRVRPLSVLATFASFLLSPPVVRAAWAAKQARASA